MSLPYAGVSLFWTSATIGFYGLGLMLRRAAHQSALVNAPLTAIILVALLLRVTHTSYETYFRATWVLTFLLGPATVALGIPLATHLVHVRRSWMPLSCALVAGTITAMLSGFFFVRLLGGSDVLAFSMLPKAATTPIAMSISSEIGGVPGLTATLAIFGGIAAAILLRTSVRLLGVNEQSAIGLAAGTAGSGIGAAHAATLGEIPGAFAAIGISLTGLLTALLAPLLVWLLR